MDVQFALDTIPSVSCNSKNGHGRPIFGRDIAHSHRSAGERAALAAQLVLGERTLFQPTATQAGPLVRASLPYIHIARLLKPATRMRVARGELSLVEASKANGLAEAWFLASPEERAALGSIVGVNQIWDDAIQPSI
jgi:hypothetical protein